MAKINDGGPAFPPNAGWRDNDPAFRGMSLRDWFASQAIAGLIVNEPKFSDAELDRLFPGRVGITGAEMVAGAAYEIADALLSARSEEGAA